MNHRLHFSNKVVRQVILWVLLLVAIVVLLQLAPVLSKPASLPVDDYFHLWAAGKLNLQGKNPFNDQLVEQLRMIEGGNPSITKISVMLNPPWMITLLMPFSLLNYPLSRLLWLIFSIVLILLAAILFWQIYSGDPKHRWMAILAVFIFGPTISMLEKGQVTYLAVLGIALFVYFIDNRRNDWLAGISLSLITVKPQITLLFWIATLLWTIKQKRWVIPLSFGVSTFLLLSIAVVFNHDVISEYLGLLATYRMSEWATPTIGSYLRYFWLGTDKFWLQYLPALFGGAWTIYYWYKHQASWNWADELPILLLVSIVVSPYSWSYDLIIALPAIILVALWLSNDWQGWRSIFILSIYLSISFMDLYLHRILDEFWFAWLAPVLLIFYLLLHRRYSIEPAEGKLTKQSVG